MGRGFQREAWQGGKEALVKEMEKVEGGSLIPLSGFILT